MNLVAWMVEKDDDVSFIMSGAGLTKPDGSWDKVTPVYTLKELTDDEIDAIWIQCLNESTVSQLPTAEFARSILRKAQEK